jgi:hypothetical protein
VRSFLSTVLFIALCGVVSTAQTPASVEFPFRFQDGFIWVKVSLSRAEKPLNFLVDTGAGVSAIDQGVARRLGLKQGKRVRVTGVQVTVFGFWPQRVTATVGDVALPEDLLAVDLAALSRGCTAPVDGLLGADFFHGKVVQIDFRERMIRLLAPEQAEKLSRETLALDIRSCGMRVPVSINGGKAQWLRLDTGCAAPLHWVTASIEPEHCQRRPAIGLAKLSLPATTVSVQVGSTKCGQVAAVIHEREIFPGEAGLLGIGLLSQFAQVTIDAKAKRLILNE